MKRLVEPGVPAFAVVGRVNMGKSAVIATLLEIDDNEVVRVSPTPGETTRAQPHRVVCDGRECIRFIDTPGFSRPIEAMREIQALHGAGVPDLETLRRFAARPGPEFEDEKRLLEPLLEGAGVLYVVDPTRPLRDDFLAEMEILRWSGRPRLALLNRRGEAAGAEEDRWRERLGSAFNLTRTFDAHRARYDERLRLFKVLLEIEEGHREMLERTIGWIIREWDQRRELAAEALLDLLREALELRVSATLDRKELQVPARRRRAEELLEKRYFEKLADLERRCFARWLEIYHHHLLKADADPGAFSGIDLESAESWTKWGLERGQLAVAAGIAGGAAGLAFDAATGGLSHGAGAIAGAVGGLAVAWWKGGGLPELRIDLGGRIQAGSGESRRLSVGPPRNPNFPWVLMDGALSRYVQVVGRAHGRRDEARLGGGVEVGFTRNFSAERRAVMARWFGQCQKGKMRPESDAAAFSEVVGVLEECGAPGAG
jgi:hypothetical protein